MFKSLVVRGLNGCGVVLVVVGLAGCSAIDANVNHGDLQVTTHLSETVFLDPVPQVKRTIYISARNTSDHPEIELKSSLVAAIAARGYVVVQDPNEAQFLLRLNILQAGEVDPKSKAGMLTATYGEPLLGGAVAAGLTSVMGGSAATTTGVGLGVAAATFLANQAWQQKTYSVVTDVELSSRPLSGQKVQQRTDSQAAQANGSSKLQSTGNPTGADIQGTLNTSTSTVNSRSVSQSINEESDFKKYQIRAVAYCDQVNLKFENAVMPLEMKLTSALSNLFEEGVAPTVAQLQQEQMLEKAAQHQAAKKEKEAPAPVHHKKASAPKAVNLDEDTPPPPPQN